MNGRNTLHKLVGQIEPVFPAHVLQWPAEQMRFALATLVAHQKQSSTLSATVLFLVANK